MVCDTRTYLVLAADTGIGPWPDDPSLEPLARRSHGLVPFDTLLADAGYDSERAHVLLREELGAQSIIPPLRGRPSARGPQGRWRRLMYLEFPKNTYGQRWQIESLFSQDKRRFGSQLSASSVKGQLAELQLRVLVHNIAIILRARQMQRGKPADELSFQQSRSGSFSPSAAHAAFERGPRATGTASAKHVAKRCLTPR